jgi:hypothetical protein
LFGISVDRCSEECDLNYDFNDRYPEASSWLEG